MLGALPCYICLLDKPIKVIEADKRMTTLSIHDTNRSDWYAVKHITAPDQSSSASVFSDPFSTPWTEWRNDWTVEEIKEIYQTALLELVFQAAALHRQFHDPLYVQQCTLLSIKTGACSEDCAYCPQSARYATDLKPEPLMTVPSVIAAAKEAQQSGSTRFCMGAAWREVKDNQDFENILTMVKEVNQLGLEVCCTLGMLTLDQAVRLKEAGLSAYNHNLDTSSAYYSKIISTRTYDDRLSTLRNVSAAGINVCCGGIIGMGESEEDRIHLIHTLATLPEHPESIPVNALVPVAGTPLANQPTIQAFDLVRMIATIRIAMPSARIRLSAGRIQLSFAEQALCFMAGANSIFTGEKLLTTPNCEKNQDQVMFELLGIKSSVTEG